MKVAGRWADHTVWGKLVIIATWFGVAMLGLIAFALVGKARCVALVYVTAAGGLGAVAVGYTRRRVWAWWLLLVGFGLAALRLAWWVGVSVLLHAEDLRSRILLIPVLACVVALLADRRSFGIGRGGRDNEV